ncbi:MAG TPA: HD domain-containing protein [Ktedonobacteraceae bacterium]
MEKEMGLSNGIIDQAIRLAIACHDLGKLNQTWQQWALSWQILVREKQKRDPYQLPDQTYCFAKTDYNYSRQQRQWQKEVQPKRPTHACESVAIARNLIGTSLGITKTGGKERLPLLRAACGAIARHHTSQASKHGTAILNERTRKAAEEALKAAHQGAEWTFDPSQLVTHIHKENDLMPSNAGNTKLTLPSFGQRQEELETWLYFVIVRALRLSDQRAG